MQPGFRERKSAAFYNSNTGVVQRYMVSVNGDRGLVRFDIIDPQTGNVIEEQEKPFILSNPGPLLPLKTAPAFISMAAKPHPHVTSKKATKKATKKTTKKRATTKKATDSKARKTVHRKKH